MLFDTKNLTKFNARVSSAVSSIMAQWTDTYKKKNSNYGSSWLLTGETLSLWFPQGITLDTPRKFVMIGLVFRMLDKIIRASHLELTAEKDKVDEQSSETFGDLGVYAFMAASAAVDEKDADKVVDLRGTV
jgi:hypothetical protein